MSTWQCKNCRTQVSFMDNCCRNCGAPPQFSQIHHPAKVKPKEMTRDELQGIIRAQAKVIELVKRGSRMAMPPDLVEALDQLSNKNEKPDAG